MAPKRRRSPSPEPVRFDDSSDSDEPWDADADVAAEARDQAGHALVKHLLQLCARGTLDATSFCIACYHAAES
eukprot:4768895-Pyramimonas_sp.AAC.1